MAILLGRADRLIGALASAALWVSGVTILAVAIMGAVNVITTNAFNQPIPSTIELTEAGHVIIVFLALAAIQRARENIVVDIVTNRMSPPVRTVAELVALFCGMFLFAMIAWRGTVLAAHSVSVREIAESYLTFPVYPMKIALAFGAAIASLEFGRQFIRLLFRIDRFDEHGQWRAGS